MFPDAKSMGKYSIQKNRGKQGYEQDFPIVITHEANFLSMPLTVLFKEILRL